MAKPLRPRQHSHSRSPKTTPPTSPGGTLQGHYPMAAAGTPHAYYPMPASGAPQAYYPMHAGGTPQAYYPMTGAGSPQAYYPMPGAGSPQAYYPMPAPGTPQAHYPMPAGGQQPYYTPGAQGMGYQMAVTGQPPPPGYIPPPQRQWMPQVQVSNCPAGLEYLAVLDQLIIQQETHLLEVLLPWEVSNKYSICNNVGQRCYYAFEERDIFCQLCCGPNRKFHITITDNFQNTVLTVRRPFKCFADRCCAVTELCQNEVSVFAANESLLGKVQQAFTIFRAHYFVFDAAGQPVYEILGRSLCDCGFGDVKYPVYTLDGTRTVAVISKQWSGIMREYFTDSDRFGITFHESLSVDMKATLLGCVFLIDFMFYEAPPGRGDNPASF